MEDNIQSVYNKFVSFGYEGTEDDFRNYISDDANIPNVYKKLASFGYEGTEDDFRGYIGRPKQDGAAPARVDVSDVEQAEQANTPVAQQAEIPTVTMEQMDGVGHYQPRTGGEPLKTPEELEAEAREAAGAVQIGKAYQVPELLSQENYNAMLKDRDALKKEYDEAVKEYNKGLQKASGYQRLGFSGEWNREKEEKLSHIAAIDEAIDKTLKYEYEYLRSPEGQAYLKAYEDYCDQVEAMIKEAGGDNYTALGRLAGALANTQMNDIKAKTPEEIEQEQKMATEGNQLIKAKRDLNNARRQLRMIRERLEGDYGGFRRGWRATDVEGLSSINDFADNMTQLGLAKKVREGKELSNADKVLLAANQLKAEVDWEYASSNTTWERVGMETAAQGVTTIEFLVGSGLTGSMEIAGGVSKNLMKNMGTKAAKDAVIGQTRNLLRTGAAQGVGMMAGAGVQTFANPLSYLNMMSDYAEKRTGTIYYDDKDKQIHYFDNEKSIALSLWQAAAGAYVENLTEFSGEGLDKLGKLGMSKIFKAVPELEAAVGTISGFLDKVKFSQITGLNAPAMDEYLRHAGFNGTLGEYGEEVLGNIIRPFMYLETEKGDSYGKQLGRGMKNLIDEDQNLETFLSCAVTGVFLGATATARSTALQGMSNAENRRQIRDNIAKLDAMMDDVRNLNKEDFKQYVASHNISEISQYIKEQAKANDWSEDELGMVAMYVSNVAAQQAYANQGSEEIKESVDALAEQAKQLVNKWDGEHIYNVSFKDPKTGEYLKGTIVNGRVHYTENEDGTYKFNPYTSSGMLAIRIDGTDKIMQVSGRQVLSLDNVATIDEQLEAQGQTVKGMMEEQFRKEGMMPTVESAWGFEFEPNGTVLFDRYEYMGKDAEGNYSFLDNKARNNESAIVKMTEEEVISMGLRQGITLMQNQMQNEETVEALRKQLQDMEADADLMDELDELKKYARGVRSEGFTKAMWKLMQESTGQFVTIDENGLYDEDKTTPNDAAVDLFARCEGNSEKAHNIILKTIVALMQQANQMENAVQDYAGVKKEGRKLPYPEAEGDMTDVQSDSPSALANVEAINMQAGNQDRAAKQIAFLEQMDNVLAQMNNRVEELKEEDARIKQEKIAEMPVSQMEVGQEFPVMCDGQQAVAVVVGKDADGRNVLTIRDQEGNDLESGIDDWTDEQWESMRVQPVNETYGTDGTDSQEPPMESAGEGTEQEQPEPQPQPEPTPTPNAPTPAPVQPEPAPEQSAMPMRKVKRQVKVGGQKKTVEAEEEDYLAVPAERTYQYLYEELASQWLTEQDANDIVNNNLNEANKTLDEAKKKTPSATGSAAARIAEKQQIEDAIKAAQGVVDYWNAVKAMHDKVVAERLAAQQAADEERHAQAVAEEEARRAEEERKAREREATGANNVAPNIREKWEGAQRVEGNADEITLANGERIAGHYVLVESGAASASHDALHGFAKTEGFPLDENEQSVNDRDYERDQNAQQITRQIAAEYDSRALQQPVVVSQDGVVLSGNGRTMAGEIAAAQNTDGAYIDYLKKYAPKYGFTPEQVEGMTHPRVVFVPDASMPYTAETFAKFNQQEMKGQSKTEQAVKLGKLVDDATFGRIIRSINRFDTLGDFYADTKATADAIGELLKAGAINQMQHTEMFDGDAISAQGREILENMLIGKAFESNPDAVRQLAAYKSLRQSVITALAEISNNIALGEYSLESELSDAIALAYNARKNGYKAGDAVSEFARQGKLFETEEDATAADYTNATVLMLADVMNDNRETRLKKVLSIYNQQAEQSAAGQTDLFAEGVKTKQDILDEVLVLLQHGTESEQQQALDAAREQRKAAAEQGTGVQENGDTGEGDAGERGNEQSAGADVGGRQTDLGGSQPRQSGGENTEEVDENGRPFVKAADGSTVFGEIRESSGLQPAPIKLSEGYQDQDGKGYGLVHIEANHGEQIRNEGFETVEDFVSYVAQNYDEDNIRVGKRRENGNTTFLIQVTDEHDNTLFIELSQDGSYWNVNSAGVFRKGYSNKKETVAKTEPQQPNNTVSTDSSLSESEESGIAPSEPNGESTVSDGKNTENSETESEKQEKISETSETPMESAGEGTEQTPPGPLSEGELGPTDEAVAAANEEVDTNPTEAQKEAGNYKKGHVTIDGFDISIENPAGSTRSGTDAQGNPWSVTMHNSYGYIRMTEGVDGDHIDIFLSDHIDDWNGTVYVVDQVNEDGSFDEHKVMYGFNSAEEAREAYLSNYSEGWQGLGTITGVSREEFKKWVDSSHRKTKAFAEYKSVQTTEGQGEAAMESRTERTEPYNSFAELVADTEITVTDPSTIDKMRKIVDKFFTHGSSNIRHDALGSDYNFVYLADYLNKAEAKLLEPFATQGTVEYNDNNKTATWVDEEQQRIYFIKYSTSTLKLGIAGYIELAKTKETSDSTEEQPKLPNTTSKAVPAKIDDVGEKIGGARKDLAQQMSGKIKLDADTFPKMFPKFDLKKLVEQGLDPKMAAAVMFLRQSAYAEYKQKNKRQGKVKALAAAKFFAAYAKQVLEKGDTDVEFTDSGWVFTDYGKIHVRANIALYGKIHDKMGNDMFDVDLTGYEILPVNVDSKSTYTAYRKNENGENVPFKPAYVTKTKSRTSYFKEDELDQAIDEVVKMVDQGVSYDKSHPYKLSVYYTRGKENSFYVGVKIGNEVKALTEPGSLDATRTYLDEHEAELQAEAARVEQQTKEAKKNEHPVAKVEIVRSYKSQEGTLYGYVFAVKIDKGYVNIMDDMFDLRTIYKYEKEHHDELQEKAQQILDQYLAEKESGKGWKPQLNLGGGRARVGEDYRKGRDIGAEEFRETLGFRGVEFGNYVTQKERQRYLNEAYDAFMDLAELLGVSPKALSLGGQLGFAIGARGGGGKNAAHYEPELNVINLTKTQGAGSVAHEWWHALDFYFNRRNGERKRPATGNTKAESFDASVRREMAEAFVGLMEKINNSEYFRRSKRLDNKTNRQYFATDTELGARAFQDYVQRRLTERGQVNDFLSSFTPEERWNGEETTYPYPTGEEANAIDERFDNLFSTMEEREEDGKTVLFSIREEAAPEKTKKVYKLMRLEDGKLYPLFIDRKAMPIELGVWYNADSPEIADMENLEAGFAYKIDKDGNVVDSKKINRTEKGSITGLPNVNAVNEAAEEGSRWITVTTDKSGKKSYHNVGINGSEGVSTFAMRPGWHAGSLPSMRQIGKGKNKDLRDSRFVWVEGEVAADVDYQAEADANPNKDIATHIPANGYYMKATNADKVKSQADRIGWYISGAFKPNRVISDAEARQVIDEYNAAHPEAPVDYDYEREGGVEFTEEDAKRVNGSNKTEAKELAYNAVREALANAGIEVVEATEEEVKRLKDSRKQLKDSKGTIRGWVGNDGKIHLTKDGLNAETPIHEYTHLWAEALQMNNPELWEQIKGLLKGTPEWKRITSMKEYSNLKDDDRIAGEVLAHISGKRNAERMEAEAKRMIDEAPTLEEAAKAANLLGRMRDALKKFWTWVGKTLLGKKGNINIDQVSNMVLTDLTNGVDPFHPRGGKRTNRTKRTDASIESEQNGPNDIERVNQKFNDELQQQIDGTLPKGHVYEMGMPSAYLRSTGIPNLPIRLQSSILNKKSDDPLHPYELEEVKDLVKLIQKPLAIFAYGDKTKSQNLMIGISQPTAEGKQFLVGLALNPDVNGKTLEINSVRNVFPKNYHDWIYWIIQGKMLRVDDRESIKAIIDALRINPVDYISDNDLDSAANIVENFENPQVEGENFSDVDLSIVGPDNQIAEEYNRMTGYNSDDVSGYVRGKEELLRSFFDGLRPLEQMQQLVEKALGRKLRDSENAYGLATLLPSLNKAMMDKAETEFMLPVLRQSANMMRRLIGRRGHRKMSREEAREMLNNYLLAKHGLERNEWFYQQALANDPDAEEEDKAGLRGLAESLGENPDDYKAVAEQVVADFEDMFDATEIGDYWASMKALTDRMLEISFESGMIGKDAFESLKARHQYYVPLRGFADGTSGDLFDYVSRHPHFQSVFKKMKGRKSKADDPLANLYNMLQSAIVIGNQNKVMQNIYNLAVNAKSDLLRVNRSWYVYNDATDEWEERFPDIPEDATADEIDAIMKQFDADMQQLKQQGKAEQYLNKMNLGKRVLPYQAKEHEMTAYINGRKVMMHVAGNPLVAQQLNKSNTQQLGWFAETVQSLTRFASRINTSLSPAFMFTNAARDIGFSLYSATVTGGLKKNLQMVGNLFRAGWVLPRLILTGKMGGGITKMFSPTEAAKIEQWWNEFIDNGGETGFTNTLSAEKAKGQVDDMIRRMINYRSKDGQLRLKKATLGVIETMGRYSEDISRFAAYCLKRAEGETVKASVNEAKNVTVNFNVKGGGNSMVARFVAGCRSCYSFFNASLQGINRMGRLAKENPKAFAACLMACVVQGAMLPWLNMALFAMLGGDDDDWEKYEMLSEYTANHNLIIFVGNHKFLKIPYSQELAPFAAMGNIWFRQQMGWNHGRSIASQIGNMFLDLAPVNIGESKTTMGKLAKTATPTILMPVTEWLLNENFTAAPIEKRYEWNKFDSGWEKAYESRTSKWLIDATRYLDEKTNGKIDINPSFVEHIATGMLGGIGRSGDNLMKYFSDGFQTQNAPYLRTIMFDSKQQGYIGAVSREYGRLAYEVLPEVKHDVDRADMLEFARLANTQDYQIANVVSIYKTGKDLLGNKTSFQGIDKLEKEYKKAEKAAMESPDNRTEQVDEYLEAMRAQINEMKMEMLDAVNQVIYEHSGEGRKGRIDRVREIREESKAKAEGKKE